MKLKKLSALLMAGVLTISLTACGSSQGISETDADLSATSSDTISKIESALDISQNNEISWTYDSQSDSWTMSITSAVTDPEIEDDQGVSVNVPGAYVQGLDTDGDGKYTATDYLMIKTHFKKAVALTDIYLTAADVTANGKLTVSDYIMLRRIVAGK